MPNSRKSTEVRQKQIIDAARQMIVRYGSEHVTVRRIASAVQISEAAIYRHFKSKRDILLLLADDIQQNLVGDIPITFAAEGSSLAGIGNILRDHISAIEQRQGVSYQVIAEIISLGDRKLNQRFYEIVSSYVDNLTRLIMAAAQHGELRQDVDPHAAAMQLYGMIQGLVSIWALSNFTFNLAEHFERLWELFRSAVSCKAAADLPARQ